MGKTALTSVAPVLVLCMVAAFVGACVTSRGPASPPRIIAVPTLTPTPTQPAYTYSVSYAATGTFLSPPLVNFDYPDGSSFDNYVSMPFTSPTMTFTGGEQVGIDAEAGMAGMMTVDIYLNGALAAWNSSNTGGAAISGTLPTGPRQAYSYSVFYTVSYTYSGSGLLSNIGCYGPGGQVTQYSNPSYPFTSPVMTFRSGERPDVLVSGDMAGTITADVYINGILALTNTTSNGLCEVSAPLY